MKKILLFSLSLGMFLLVGVSVSNAQFVAGARVEVVTGAYNLNIRPTASTAGTALGSVNSGAKGVVTDGPVFGQGYSWSKVRWDGAPEGWSVNTPWLRVISAPQSGCGDVNKDGAPNVLDVNLVVNVAFRGVSSTYVTDVNGSGATDMIDVAEEVDYVFRGMAEPTGCTQSNQRPVMTIIGPTSVVTGQSNTWALTGTDPEGANLNYTIQWNGGIGPGVNDNNVPSGQTRYYSHIYDSPGTYYPAFLVSERTAGALSALESRTIIVSNSTSTPNQPPVITSLYGASSTVVGVPGRWYAYVSDPDSPTLYYSFSFGDGSAANNFYYGSNTTMSSTHTYASAGNYTLTLMVNDANSSTTRTLPVTVTASSSPGSGQPPVINSLTGPASLVVNATGTWFMTATDPEGANLRYDFYWDGSCTSGINCVVGYMNSGATISATNAFSQAGSHTVLGRVSDGGTLVTRTVTVNVTSTTSPPSPSPTKTFPKTDLLAPSASALNAVQFQLDQIRAQLMVILGQLGGY